MLHAAWKHAVIRILALALLVTGLPAGAVAHAASHTTTATDPAALVDGTIVYGVAGETAAEEGSIYAELPGQPRVELARGARPIVSDDGKWLAFKRGNPVDLNAAELWLLDLATGQEYDVTSSLDRPIWRVIGYSFSRDGKRLLFDYNNGLYTYDLVAPGGAPEWITAHGDLKAPAEAPDGVIWYSGDVGLFTVPGHQRQPETYNDAGFPRLSSTGRLVAFQSIRTPSGDNFGWDPWARGNIAIWDADAPGYPGRAKTTAVTNLRDNGNGVVGPVQWARDDSAVLAAAHVEGVGGLWQFAIGAGSELLPHRMPIATDAVTLGGQVGGFTPGPLPQDDMAGEWEPGDTVRVRILDNDLGAGSSTKGDWIVTVEGSGLEGDLQVTGIGAGTEVVYTISADDGGVVEIPYRVCVQGGFPACGTATVRIGVRHPSTALKLTVIGPTDGEVATRSQVEYDVEVTNLGGEAEHAGQRAVDVEFVLELPVAIGYGGVTGGSGQAFDACTVRKRDVSDGRGLRFKRDLVCRAKSLPVGGTIAATVTLIAPPVPMTEPISGYASAANAHSSIDWHSSLSVTGARGSPQVAIVSDLNPAAEGSDVTFTVTVAGLGADASTGAADVVPTGQVVLFIDGVLNDDVGDVSLADGSASIYFYADLAPGPHEVTARYLGDGSYLVADSPPLTQVIGSSGPDLAVTMTHSDPFTAGRTGTYTVTVANNGTADADAGAVLDLSFPPGISHLGQAISGDFTCVWKPIFTGNPRRAPRVHARRRAHRVRGRTDVHADPDRRHCTGRRRGCGQRPHLRRARRRSGQQRRLRPDASPPAGRCGWPRPRLRWTRLVASRAERSVRRSRGQRWRHRCPGADHDDAAGPRRQGCGTFLGCRATHRDWLDVREVPSWWTHRRHLRAPEWCAGGRQPAAARLPAQRAGDCRAGRRGAVLPGARRGRGHRRAPADVLAQGRCARQPASRHADHRFGSAEHGG